MKNINYMGLLAGVVLATTANLQQTQAVPLEEISGAITFSGGITLNTTSVDTASKVTGWTDPVVTSDDGSFAGIAINTPGAVTLAAPWSFNSGPLADLWSAGGFNFNLTESTTEFQADHALYVYGTGLITGSGYLPTPGVWTFTSSDPGAGHTLVFSFQSASGTVAVPDGGMTMIMLGGMAMGFVALRRNLNLLG